MLEDDDYDDVDCFHSISKKVLERCKRKCSEEDYTAFVVYDDEVFFTNKDAAQLEEAADGGRRMRDATLYIRVDSEGAQSEGDAGGAAGEEDRKHRRHLARHCFTWQHSLGTPHLSINFSLLERAHPAWAPLRDVLHSTRQQRRTSRSCAKAHRQWR